MSGSPEPGTIAAVQAGAASAQNRVAEVRAAVGAVRDPEIDETVAALDFVAAVAVEGGRVRVSMVLPTFWCPANFVYLMAEDMRRAVLALPWAETFELALLDHFAAEEISRGVNQGLGFAEAFPGQAGGHLPGLKRSFERKAFLMRQAALVAQLRRHGLADAAIVTASAAELDRIAAADTGVAEALSEYRRTWDRFDFRPRESDPAIVDPAGRSLAAEALPDHLRRVRRLTTGATANAEMCRILMAARRSKTACSSKS